MTLPSLQLLHIRFLVPFHGVLSKVSTARALLHARRVSHRDCMDNLSRSLISTRLEPSRQSPRRYKPDMIAMFTWLV